MTIQKQIRPPKTEWTCGIRIQTLKRNMSISRMHTLPQYGGLNEGSWELR
jgi:hypothetical protein